VNEQKFWILALRKESGSKKITVIVVSSDYVPEIGERLQILSHVYWFG
jgi:hypothetical protein